MFSLYFYNYTGIISVVNRIIQTGYGTIETRGPNEP